MSFKGRDRKDLDDKDTNSSGYKRSDKDDRSSGRSSGRRGSPPDRKRDFRDRSPFRDSDSVLRRGAPRGRDERLEGGPMRDNFNDRRRIDDSPIDRRLDPRQQDMLRIGRDSSMFGGGTAGGGVGGGVAPRAPFKESFGGIQDNSHPNDCEIIVPNKMQRTYAEIIERRLKNVGLRVDLLFPHEDTPLPQVLDDISRKGCLYAIVVLLQNEKLNSATVNILWGSPQEHRNMPLDDAMNLIARNFETYTQSMRDRANPPAPPRDRVEATAPIYPPPAEGSIQVLLNLLSDGRPLSIAEIDKVIRHLQDRKERILKDMEDPIVPPKPQAMLGNPGQDQAKLLADQQAELQKRILSILNQNQGSGAAQPGSSPQSSSQSVRENVENSRWGGVSESKVLAQNSQQNMASPTGGSINFDNPNIQKALDNLIQSGPNLLRSIQGGPSGGSPTGGGGGSGNPRGMRDVDSRVGDSQHGLGIGGIGSGGEGTRGGMLGPGMGMGVGQSGGSIPGLMSMTQGMNPASGMGFMGGGMRFANQQQQRHPLMGTPTGNSAQMGRRF